MGYLKSKSILHSIKGLIYGTVALSLVAQPVFASFTLEDLDSVTGRIEKPNPGPTSFTFCAAFGPGTVTVGTVNTAGLCGVAKANEAYVFKTYTNKQLSALLDPLRERSNNEKDFNKLAVQAIGGDLLNEARSFLLPKDQKGVCGPSASDADQNGCTNATEGIDCSTPCGVNGWANNGTPPPNGEGNFGNNFRSGDGGTAGENEGSLAGNDASISSLPYGGELLIGRTPDATHRFGFTAVTLSPEHFANAPNAGILVSALPLPSFSELLGKACLTDQQNLPFGFYCQSLGDVKAAMVSGLAIPLAPLLVPAIVEGLGLLGGIIITTVSSPLFIPGLIILGGGYLLLRDWNSATYVSAACSRDGVCTVETFAANTLVRILAETTTEVILAGGLTAAATSEVIKLVNRWNPNKNNCLVCKSVFCAATCPGNFQACILGSYTCGLAATAACAMACRGTPNFQ